MREEDQLDREPAEQDEDRTQEGGLQRGEREARCGRTGEVEVAREGDADTAGAREERTPGAGQTEELRYGVRKCGNEDQQRTGRGFGG